MGKEEKQRYNAAVNLVGSIVKVSLPPEAQNDVDSAIQISKAVGNILYGIDDRRDNLK